MSTELVHQVIMCAGSNISALIGALESYDMVGYKVTAIESKYMGVRNISFVVQYPEDKQSYLPDLLRIAKGFNQKSVMYYQYPNWVHVGTDGTVLKATHTAKVYSEEPDVESWSRFSNGSYVVLG